MSEVKLITQRGNQNPTNKYNVIEEDPASFFDGENDNSTNFDEEVSSEAGGLRGFIQNRRDIQRQRQKRKNMTAKSKAAARVNRTGAKKIQAQSQRDTAKVLGK